MPDLGICACTLSSTSVYSDGRVTRRVHNLEKGTVYAICWATHELHNSVSNLSLVQLNFHETDHYFDT